MVRTLIFKLAVASVVLFGLLATDASSESFDEEDLLSQFEDNVSL